MNEALAHTEDSSRADQRADARRSDQLDAGAVGRVSRVGDVAQGLRPGTEASKVQSRGDRDEESYVIDAGLKLLRLLECVESRNREPITINRLMQRTGFNRDLTRRLVITA